MVKVKQELADFDDTALVAVKREGQDGEEVPYRVEYFLLLVSQSICRGKGWHG